MFIPFGKGPKECVGQRLAMLEMNVIFKYVIDNFNLYIDQDLRNIKVK